MNWAPIKAGLVALGKLSGITQPGAIVWEGTPTANELVVGTRLIMGIGTVRGIGEDIETREDQAGADQVVAVQGDREFTWVARFESMSSTPPTDALTYAENLRSRLRRSTAVAIAQASNLAIVEVGDTTRVAYIVQGRQVSCYQVIITVGTTENDIDDTAGAGGYVAEVNGAGALDDGAGATLDFNTSVGPVS